MSELHDAGTSAERRGGRRLALLAEGALGVFSAKTAVGLLRYCPEDVVCVLDSAHAGRTTAEVLGLEPARPIVASLQEAVRCGSSALVIGIAPRGGDLPDAWRQTLLQAIDHGLDVISGLHLFLGDDAQLAARARQRGVKLVDLRRPPAELRLPRPPAEEDGNRPPLVALTVGSDCNVGKMTACLEIVRSARRAGIRAAFAATGQTGILIAGHGVPIDRVIADFVSGAADQLVFETSALEHPEWLLVEGQGSLLHPAYSAVTLGLLHGVRPDLLILCHHVGRAAIDGYDVPLPGPGELVRLYEQAATWVSSARVACVALNPHGADEDQVHAYRERVHAETGLACADPLLDAALLVDALVDTGAGSQRRQDAPGVTPRKARQIDR